MSLKKILCAILSGILLTASFPPYGTGWVAWIAIVPLLAGLKEERPLNAFRLGMVAGLVHYLTLIYWIVFVTNTYGGIDLFTSFAILLLFSLYLSLYPAVFSLLVNLSRGTGSSVLSTAAIWVSLEYVRGLLMTGFPWCLMGYSQYRYYPVIQISDITGVYGVSFLIAAVNAGIYALFFSPAGEKGKRRLIREVSAVALMLSICLAYGFFRLSDGSKDDTGKFIGVSVVQGNIDQSVKWDPAFMEATMDRYTTLTRSVMGQAPDLIVWPESAAPFFFQEDTGYSGDVYDMVRESGAWLIFGCPAYKEERLDITYFNRVYLLSPEGLEAGYYDKVHLVPFGEYVPLKRFIPFINRLVISEGEFSPGERSGLLNMSGITAGALVCYEAILPALAGREVKGGAAMLVNLTNDAWFGMTSAPYQHLCMCVFRAVENRRPFVRAANTGFSAFIDTSGRITARSGLFVEDVLTGKVRIDCNRITFYTRYGDIFIYLVLIICLIKFFHELCYHFVKR